MSKIKYPKDITGLKFGKLTVISFSYHRYANKPNSVGRIVRKEIWNCICDCGNFKEIIRGNLINGVISCGCALKQNNVNRSKLLEDNNQAAKIVYRNYKSKCKTKMNNINFDLTLDDFIKLTSQNCYLCGAKPSNIQKTYAKYANFKDYVYNGIDRFDNTQGYTIDNSKPCCSHCNRAKNDRDIKDYIDHMRRVIAHIDSNEELKSLVSEEQGVYYIKERV